MQASTFVAIVLGASLSAACGKGSNGSADKPPDPSAAPTGTCLIGTWAAVESGVTRSFTFRGDQTGEEVYAPDDVRPLTWALENDKTVHIIYPAREDHLKSEFDLGFDCGTKTLGPAGMYQRK